MKQQKIAKRVKTGSIIYGTCATCITFVGMSGAAYHTLAASGWVATIAAGVASFLVGLGLSIIFIGIAAGFCAWRKAVRSRYRWGDDED
jgi:predicted phage tail protein